MPALAVREDLHAEIESRVRALLDERLPARGDYGTTFEALRRAVSERVLGGKLLRPRLLLEMHHALSRGTRRGCSPDRTVTLTIAAAVEILHFALLVHDDVIDEDLQRRGASNLIDAARRSHASPTSPAALHWGRSSGILMGDLLLTSVHQIFARADVDHATRLRLLDLLEHTVTETIAGEQTDVALSDGVVEGDLQTILTMTANKTATYTFEFPLRVAAALAGSDSDTESRLAVLGRSLGLAFQLQDDLLSVFGEPAEHGKDPHSDLREGKMTPLIAYARMTTAWPVIRQRFGCADMSVEDAAEMTRQLHACGADAFVQSLIDDELTAVRTAVTQPAGSLPPAAGEILLEVARRIEGRRS